MRYMVRLQAELQEVAQVFGTHLIVELFWHNSGQTAGTTGKAKAIEAMQIRLTGGMEQVFDIYYRMHVANYGWLGWAKMVHRQVLLMEENKQRR